MAQATALAATTSAGNSSDIVVSTASGNIKVALFMTGGSVLNANERALCVIQAKDVNGVYSNVDRGGGPLCLSRLHPEQVLIGNGTYRVVKSATTNAIGVMTDTGV